MQVENGHGGQAADKIEISLGVCVAGGRVVAACLADPGLLSKANAAGEIASRVYQAMVLQARAEAQARTDGCD